jgi:hypothetical protein
LKENAVFEESIANKALSKESDFKLAAIRRGQ